MALTGNCSALIFATLFAAAAAATLTGSEAARAAVASNAAATRPLMSLREAHVKAMKQDLSLVETVAVRANHTAGPMLGSTAPMTAEGFVQVTSLCCEAEMGAWYRRLIDDLGYTICHEGGIYGLVPWFACVPSMDYNYVLEVIHNIPGQECKFIAKKGEECQPLTDFCLKQDGFPAHRRRAGACTK